MNIKVFNTLPQDRSTGAQYAVIARLDGKSTWEFLLLPTEIQWSKAASYQASNTGGNIPVLQYASTGGWSISMSFPVMSGSNRVLTDYISRLVALLEPENGAPPPLFWQWGQRRLSPCVLARCEKTENLWAKDGELLGCKIAITLVEISEKQLIT